MSSCAIPARLIPFGQLHLCHPGDKVRFLGCVSGYSVESGYLYLQPPRQSSRNGQDTATIHEIKGTQHHLPSIIAEVDTTLVREHLGRQDIIAGSYLNIIGYVQSKSTGNRRLRPARIDVYSTAQIDRETRTRYEEDYDFNVHKVRIQSIVIWTSNQVDTKLYSEALEARMRCFEDES